MDNISTRVLEYYKDICSDTDPRIQDWPFIDPVIPSLVIIAYLLFVYLGPKWMAGRPPFKIQTLIILYNFIMVIFSAYIVIEMLLGGWLFDYTLRCQTVDYSNSPTALRMASAVWFFYIAKFVELLDTVFFILKKKNNQVSFLHVFHHGCLPMFWWWGVKAVPGGFGTFHALVNCCVHVVMYLYYGIAALGPKYQKYLWWKRYVTIFQLAQFFIVTLHNSQFLFMECSYPWKYVAFIQGFTTIVAVLFLNFYIKTYRGSSRQKQQTTQKNGHVRNGDVSNGHVMNGRKLANGYSNGLKAWERKKLGAGLDISELKRRPLSHR